MYKFFLTLHSLVRDNHQDEFNDQDDEALDKEF